MPTGLTVADAINYFLMSSQDEIKTSSSTEEAKHAISNALTSDKSEFLTHYRSLTEQDKIALISGLILLNKKAFNDLKSFFAKEIIDKQLTEEDIKKIITEKNNFPISPFILVIIAIAMTEPNDDKPLTDVNKKHIIINIMSSIPDTYIDPATKYEISQMFVKLSQSSPLTYNAATPSLLKAQPSLKISNDDLKKALESEKIDSSQYILLSTDFLQKIIDEMKVGSDTILKPMGHIRKLYAETNYKHAFMSLQLLCNYLKRELNETEEKNEMIDMITLIQTNIARVKTLNNSDIDKNYSRRFFENRIASYYRDNLFNFDSINAIVKHHFKGNPLDEAKTPEQAIMIIASLQESNTSELDLREIQLKDSSDLYKSKGRFIKPGFLSKEAESDSKSVNSVLSRNPGIMKSSQPNYYHELTDYTLQNRNADINAYSDKDTDYPLSNKESAYVSSLSGHAFWFVAILEQYIIDNLTESNVKKIERQVNDFIKAVIVTYVDQGFHSLLEVSDVFNQYPIKKIFSDYNIFLDLSWPDELLKKAFNDTQEYTKALSLRSVLQQELTDAFESSVQSDPSTAAGKKFKKIATQKDSLTSTGSILNQTLGAISNIERKAEQQDDERAALIEALKNSTEDEAEKLARIMIESKCDLNTPDIKNTTVLMHALINGKEKVAKMLVKAMFDAKYNLNTQDTNGITPLMYASFYGYEEIVKLLLAKALTEKWDLNLTDHLTGGTALIDASFNGHKEIVEMLIKVKCNVNIQTKENKTAQTYASEKGYTEIANLLANEIAENDLTAQNQHTKTGPSNSL